MRESSSLRASFRRLFFVAWTTARRQRKVGNTIHGSCLHMLPAASPLSTIRFHVALPYSSHLCLPFASSALPPIPPASKYHTLLRCVVWCLLLPLPSIRISAVLACAMCSALLSIHLPSSTRSCHLSFLGSSGDVGAGSTGDGLDGEETASNPWPTDSSCTAWTASTLSATCGSPNQEGKGSWGPAFDLMYCSMASTRANNMAFCASNAGALVSPTNADVSFSISAAPVGDSIRDGWTWEGACGRGPGVEVDVRVPSRRNCA